MEPRFIFLHLSATWASPSIRISLSSSMSPAPVKSAILNYVELILSVTTCHKMFSRHWSLLLSCPESSITIFYSLAVRSNSFTNLKIQNNAARLICRTPKSDHISPVLHALHWLPVEQRIEYKVLLLAFKSVNNDRPSYLSDLLKFYIPSRQLLSSSDAVSFAFLQSLWNPLDNANSRTRPLFYGTLFRSHSVIPTLRLLSNLL